MQRLKTKKAVFTLLMSAPLCVLLAACSMQSEFKAPETALPDAWSSSLSDRNDLEASKTEWWKALNDPATNRLVDATIAKNPTLAESLARIDEANAQSSYASASYMPTLKADGGAARLHDGSQLTELGLPGVTPYSNIATVAPRFSWELDLFGHVRSSVDAADHRIDARTAEATAMKIMLTAQVVSTTADLRSCNFESQVLENDVASYSKSLDLAKKKYEQGFISSIENTASSDALNAAKSKLARQEDKCAHFTNALTKLSGIDTREISRLNALPAPELMDVRLNMVIPKPPLASPALPASIIALHPNVIAARKDAAAAWSDIGVAKAERMPTLDVGGLLLGQWISSAGTVINFSSWALGASASATLFDGGSGGAKVDVNVARYNQKAANLQKTVQKTVEDVENALASQKSANSRLENAQNGLLAAKDKMRLSDNLWKNGLTNLIELEDSRRQLTQAQVETVTSARDRTKAWVELVLATGNTLNLDKTREDHEEIILSSR